MKEKSKKVKKPKSIVTSTSDTLTVDISEIDQIEDDIDNIDDKGQKERCLVINVHDGDTITVNSYQRKKTNVRLNGIDAPESSQNFGKEAQKFLSDLLLNKEIKIEITGTDDYRRKIANITTIDGLSVNSELVRLGYAWWFDKYCPKDESLHSLETEARNQKLGLWNEESPTPPWRWRKMEKLVQMQNELSKPEKNRLMKELSVEESLKDR